MKGVSLDVWTRNRHYNEEEFWSVLECRYSRHCIFVIMKCLRVLTCVVYWSYCCVRLSVAVLGSVRQSERLFMAV